jgi:sugar/nucleoside kinase (ribokinase family)
MELNMKNYHVYGIGNALLDIEYEVSEQELSHLGLSKGVMTLINEQQHAELLAKLKPFERRKVASGGSAANAMISLQNFGGKGFYSCKVASDETGDHYCEDMQTAGLSTNMDTQIRENGHTGKCLVFVTPDADRTMQTYLGVSETLSVKELNEVALASSEYFYIEGYLVTSPTARAAVKKAQAIAHQHGVKVSLTLSDPTIVQYFRPQFEEILADGVDLLFCNEQEAFNCTGTKNVAEAAQALRKLVKRFVITMSEKGSVLFDGHRIIEVPPHKVKAIDTIGAGDTYAGAFMYGLSQNMSWELAGALASKAAAQVVTQYGPRLSKAQTQAILANVMNCANCA